MTSFLEYKYALRSGPGLYNDFLECSWPIKFLFYFLFLFVSENPVKSIVDDSKTLFTIGEIVAANSQHDQTWHRARIIEVFESDNHDLEYIGKNKTYFPYRINNSKTFLPCFKKCFFFGRPENFTVVYTLWFSLNTKYML